MFLILLFPIPPLMLLAVPLAMWLRYDQRQMATGSENRGTSGQRLVARAGRVALRRTFLYYAFLGTVLCAVDAAFPEFLDGTGMIATGVSVPAILVFCWLAHWAARSSMKKRLAVCAA